MLRRNLVPVWIGIILLSGMFLMGQETWPPKCGPFYPDPCLSIPDAVPDSCEDVGGGDFTCDCEAGYFWEEIGHTCDDPCELDPCDAIDKAVAGSCAGISADDFTCDCSANFYWSDDTNTCEKAEPPCVPDPCQGISNGIPGTCEPTPGGACAPPTDFTCDCLAGFLWDDVSNTCEEDAVNPCDPDPCQGISNAVAGSCTDAGDGDFTCDCDQGFIWNGDSNTCEEAVPQFPGGSYEMKAWDIEQDPGGCLLAPAAVLIVRPIMRGIVIPVDIPSGEVIVDFFGNAYPLDINLPVFGLITVDLSLDGTYENMLMDGPDEYVADTSGLGIRGADCVITGSADGIFDDINTEPLTGSLTIDIASVEDSPGGTCSLLKKPTEACAITVILDAGSPL